MLHFKLQNYTVGLITSENDTVPLRGKGNYKCKAYVTLRDGGGEWQVMANIEVVYYDHMNILNTLYFSLSISEIGNRTV